MRVMKNLEGRWKEKREFWGKNGINYVYWIGYKWLKEKEVGMCRVGDVIGFGLCERKVVFEWVCEDGEIGVNM